MVSVTIYSHLSVSDSFPLGFNCSKIRAPKSLVFTLCIQNTKTLPSLLVHPVNTIPEA